MRKQRRKNERTSTLFWIVPAQAAGVLTAWSIAAGEQLLRVWLLGGIFTAMLIPLLVSLEAGLTAMLIFEPFRGILRRAQYIFLPYTDSEPIHLLTPILTMIAFLLVLFRHKLATFVLTPLAGATSVLALICTAQIFNPLQGGLYVGLTGALFFLVPMAWFYFGQTADENFVPKALRLIVVLSVIASLYGVYQIVFGYPFFEQYWIENTDLYSSIAVYNVQRALATFSSAEEWGRYIQIGGIVAVGLAMSRSEEKRRVVWTVCAAALFVMLSFTGQRSAIFGLLLGVVILILTGAKTAQSAFARVFLLLVPFVLVLALAKPIDDEVGYDLDENNKVGALLTHTTKGTINPTGEDSLFIRLDTWKRLVTEEIPSDPFGIGLGARTLAASRDHSAEDKRAVDNHFLTLALSAGVPAALLLAWILFRAAFFCFRGWRDSEADSSEADLWRIMLALTATFILNNFFGTSFTIYSIAPIGWLLVGWISAEYSRLNAVKDRTNLEIAAS